MYEIVCMPSCGSCRNCCLLSPTFASGNIAGMGVLSHCLVSRKYFHCLGLLECYHICLGRDNHWLGLDLAVLVLGLVTKTPDDWWDITQDSLLLPVRWCAAVLSLNLPIFTSIVFMMPVCLHVCVSKPKIGSGDVPYLVVWTTI